jgi:hypothetical protein
MGLSENGNEVINLPSTPRKVLNIRQVKELVTVVINVPELPRIESTPHPVNAYQIADAKRGFDIGCMKSRFYQPVSCGNIRSELSSNGTGL